MKPRQLRKFNIFKGLNDKELAAVAEKVVIREIAAGQLVVEEGKASGKTFYMINKGKVKVSRMNEEGKEVVLTMLGSGDFFGEMSLLDGSARSADVATVEKVQIYSLSSRAFLDFLKQHDKIAMNLLLVLCQRIRRSDAQIKSLTLMNSIGRIASTLIRLAIPEGADRLTRTTRKIAKLPARDILANMSGTPISTVTKALELFVKSGFAKKEGRTYVILNPVVFHDLYCI